MVKTFPLIILIPLDTIRWLIKINSSNAILRRSKKNPILIPNQSNWWESKAVFNCAILYDGNTIHMLYRAIGEYQNYISRIGYAASNDGYTFSRRKDIAFGPSENYERNGTEDPRLAEINGKTYFTYVVPSSYARGTPIASTALATTPDYYEFKRLGIITSTGSDNKDVVLFPEKMVSLSEKKKKKTYYFSLHRPSAWIGSAYGVYTPSIWLAEGSLLTNFERYWPLLSPKEDWEMLKVGSGAPPIKTEHGWLIIYHGVSYDRIYRVGAALLDLKEPIKVIGRTKSPILEPEEPYEKYGNVNNVVFPTGACIIDGQIFIYYGGADKVCCLVTAELEALVEHILQDK